ncbi:branched-chain amino acid transport system substrate-binding protein [Bradyrhizobium sp. JR7.2]|jgi:branched-chain amino acid transport system substrate-binding protein|uniref:ABC transporter substrate-binding protein n=3 Tax=Bradyrhizobium TaxID=374 RepID=A0A939RZM3_9BRAD|nr:MULTISPECIES: ABC transporter substrate-binding protein [Bradyrhizobium]AHY55268.1 ABC transporter binding protein [Bradyrhizobium japonicum SEMIA 5079]MBR0729549.1 ABC transporter substrate-binding protein [Bradyrhizobium japonicum]MBR0803665.1 ABC transporter substrate-binding protein [Bradyrhizobium japonicum]MBR0875712.1 ABC transporter substrate-binding protein [Bradyrhizobium liaoningense]MBR0909263.1 ABC transporter substrate-binding protein [Bradyrhizobium japonicum]
MRTAFWLAGAAALVLANQAFAGDTIKIGFVSTFSGPTAVIGNDMRNSFELALDHIGRKMDGKPVEVIYEDDGQKPDVGKQKTEKLVQSDKVDFIVGYIWSNVLLASLKTAVDSQTFLISANAGPSQLAGELCSPYVFSTSWQNDQTPAAMGLYMNQKGVKSVFLIGPNYAAGKDMLAGLKSTFKGEVKGEEYTVWPSQLDFSAELSKARASGAESIFVFYPGAAGVQFLNQYAQAGLKSTMPLYTAFTVDELSLPLQKENALGVPGAQEWVNDLPNEQNKRFVADYRKKYPNLRPTYYGAQAYDAAQLINSAVVAVKGDTSKKDAMKAEMEKANFKSLRGPFKYGKNHIPVQSFYLQDVVKDGEGQLSLKTVATIVENDQDRFHDKCAMK